MTRTILRSLVVSAVLGCAALPAAAATPGPVARAPAGTLAGEAIDGIHVFRGIPYAEPPVKQQRWQPPVPARPWKGTRDATRFGPACVQPPSRPGSIYSPGEALPTSEDCLSLNVWAPADAKVGGAITRPSGVLAAYASS